MSKHRRKKKCKNKLRVGLMAHYGYLILLWEDEEGDLLQQLIGCEDNSLSVKDCQVIYADEHIFMEAIAPSLLDKLKIKACISRVNNRGYWGKDRAISLPKKLLEEYPELCGSGERRE